MSGRIGTSRGRRQSRTLRQAVWYFVCPSCHTERFINARRRPTADPEDVPALTCDGVDTENVHDVFVTMENRGLYLMSYDGTSRVLEPADALRRKWAQARERILYGEKCVCSHEWWRHQVDREKMLAHQCLACSCHQFQRAKSVRRADLFAHKPDDDVPF